ncbi:MAG: hypothetical protein CMC59_06290 [Flavobacteriaceae bacterium]|nr:hypothetical protein [Flavobacteriaceae bacterium]|tara:strand:+ start:3106 stop:3819 length:714 start_codon:yes stop_codon:yes gene_type:complete
MVTKSSKNFINLISNFDPKNINQKKELESIIFEYPYFQLAHAVYLKSLKIQDQFNFDLILKKTAILSSKRKMIFNWINDTENNLFKIEKRTKKIKIKDTQPIGNQIEGTSNFNKYKEEEQIMLFVDWVMSYSNTKKENENRPLESKIEIIDSFLEKNPKIPKSKEKGNTDDFLNLASDNKFNKSELMTETLAKIYVKQQKFKEALYAYRILSLKYPEKSSLFANQIKKLQKKQNKKT